MPPRSLSWRLIVLACVTLSVLAVHDASADWIGNVRVAQPAGMHMSYDDPVAIDFDYEITAPNGARIWCARAGSMWRVMQAATSGSVAIR